MAKTSLGYTNEELHTRYGLSLEEFESYLIHNEIIEPCNDSHLLKKEYQMRTSITQHDIAYYLAIKKETFVLVWTKVGITFLDGVFATYKK